MELLPPEVRAKLPPLGSQAANAEPVIYAHLLIPDSANHWYVAEGSLVDGDFLLLGFHMGSEDEQEWAWTIFKLSHLEALGCQVVREPEFQTGRFTDVVSYPYLNQDLA